MTKTKSQCLNLVVKKEELEDKPKLEQKLHSTNNALKSKSKITKNKKPIQALNAEVKSEDVDDNKALLASSKKRTFKTWITTEQIAKLINYIINDKMNVKAAAQKVGIGHVSAYQYYKEYQDDPKHRVPLPKTGFNKRSVITQEKIENLIRYIVNKGINVAQASKKAGISRTTAAKYYAKYLEDPERKIPLLADHIVNRSKRFTQEEVADLIGYIVRDKMSLAEASKKVNMSHISAKRYYLKYLHNPNNEIPNPHKSNQRSGKPCTNDQVSSLIGYVVNDGMSLLESSIKAHMGEKAARRYYRQYLDDLEKNIPTPETNNSCVSNNSSTVDQVKNFFSYVIIDKLNVAQAAQKAKIPRKSGCMYYNKYLKNPNNGINIKDMTYSAEKMKQLVALLQNKKMSLRKAADAVDLNIGSARKHYHQYLKNLQYEFPAIKTKQYTQEDMRILIDYVERDRMSVHSAARKIKMKRTTAYKYYKEYQNDPERKIPVPIFQGQTKKSNTVDKYAQIIASIYKNNSSIKPIHENHFSD